MNQINPFEDRSNGDSTVLSENSCDNERSLEDYSNDVSSIDEGENVHIQENSFYEYNGDIVDEVDLEMYYQEEIFEQYVDNSQDNNQQDEELVEANTDYY